MKKLSEQQLAELKDSANHILAECRRKILIQYPFWGTVLMSLDIIPTRDKRIQTAATDGNKIYFDIDFLRQLKSEEQIFVLAHEVGHCVMMHMTREQNRNHAIANQAEDVEVNEMLIADGLSCPKDSCNCNTLNLPKGKSFEEYYEILLTRQQNNNQQNNSQQNNNQQNNSKKSSGGQFDKHLHKGDDMFADDENLDVEDKYGKVGHDPVYQPKIAENLTEKLRETIISAVQQVERSRGCIPGNIKKLVDKLLTPQIDWKEALATFISKSNGEGQTNWNMPNKRFLAQGIYLPSQKSEAINIGVVIDSSGSCQQNLHEFLSEVNGIVKSFGDYKLAIAECDYKVQDYQVFDNDRPLDLENNKFEIHGGGGTQMTPGLQSFAAHDDNVNCIVCFSDMYIENIEENLIDTPILWISCMHHDNYDNIKTGTVIELNKKAA